MRTGAEVRLGARVVISGKRPIPDSLVRRGEAMTHRTYALVVGVLFLLMAILQCLRMVLGWSVVVNGVNIPMWVSGIVAVVLGLFVVHWASAQWPSTVDGCRSLDSVPRTS